MGNGRLALWASLCLVRAALPEYCSKVSAAADKAAFERARAVPELSVESQGLKLELLHVSSIIRHGARTPASRYQCWRDYKPQWDCELGETIKPLLTTGADADHNDFMSFQKIYDANPAHNELGGTCGKGHLLVEGYEQHQVLGRLFAEYYQNQVPPLLTHSETTEAVRRSMRFRSSDLQRTILSGSSFIDSFMRAAGLEAATSAMTIHTMDENADSIFPNSRMCPALQTLKENLFASGTFADIELKYSRTREDFSKFADVAIWPGDFYDCVMTMICAHGEAALPNLMPELSPEARLALLNDTIKAVDEYAVFQFTSQDRVYSKTANIIFMVEFKSELIRLIVADITRRLGATQPALAADMLAKIVPLADLQEFYAQILIERAQELPFDSKRLVIYSAHDTSILQFLGSLGESLFFDKWPPYASQVIMEVYTDSENYYFRLIYNGAVVTDRIPECAGTGTPRDICSLAAFFEATKWATPSKIEAVCGATTI